MNYCQHCLNPSLSMSKKGIAHITINHKQLDNGRFLFDLNKEDNSEVVANFEKKINEFFQWYSRFNNIVPITSFELTTNNFFCSNGCPMLPHQYSIVDILIPYSKIEAVLEKYATQYNMFLKLSA
jgi:hypothetical protein